MTTQRLGVSFDVAFSPDGRWVATSGESDVKVLSANDHSLVTQLRIPNPSHLRFNPTSTAILVKTTSGALCLKPLQPHSKRFDVRRDDVEGPAPEYASENVVVDASWHGQIEVIDTATRKVRAQWRFPGEMITGVHRSRHAGVWVFLHSPKATTAHLPPAPDYLSRWAGEIPSVMDAKVQPEMGFVRASSLRPDGKEIAIVHGAPPTNISIKDATSGAERVRTETAKDDTAREVVWSPDGKILAAVHSHAVRVLDDQLRIVAEFPVRYGCAVDFTPDGRRLAIGSWEDGFVVDVPEGRPTERCS